MEQWQVYELVSGAIQTVFVFAFGACVGSLTNVLVYRMPLGLSVVSPPSRCPSCQTQLTWRENIPVLGWILLRGRCRFCRASISAEYPIVEAFVGCLFVLVYWLWFMLPADWNIWGLTVNTLRPDWAKAGFETTWPTFIVMLALFSSLTAMTIVDAKTSMIPLPLAWAPTILALIAHPLHAVWIQHSYGHLLRSARDWTWTIATPGPSGWGMIGLALGGAVGVVAANILLATGLIRRSWADYEEWEREHVARSQGEAAGAKDAGAIGATASAGAAASIPLSALEIAVPVVATAEATPELPVSPAPLALESSPSSLASPSPSDLWLEYPHARREVIKEIYFIAPIIGLAFLGYKLAIHFAGPWTFDVNLEALVPAHAAPLWLDVLAGVLGGYLIGGGVVWVLRIGGTLGFGREAMGMGDVHLLAAVGACAGAIDATLAFFASAFVGLLYAMSSAIFKGYRRAMPYGPHIAVAATLVLLLKPGLEKFLTVLLKAQPPVDLP